MSDSGDQKPLVIIGGGGHASVLLDILVKQRREIAAIVSPAPTAPGSGLSNVRRLKRDQDIERFAPDDVRLVCGVGMLPDSRFRTNLVCRFLDMGYEFETIVSQDAVVSEHVCFGDGVQVMPGCVIQPGVQVGSHTIINTGAILEHDCHIGSYNHIAPGAVLCGAVTTQTNVFIGARATVTQSITVGEASIIGAGAVLTEALEARSVLYPAKSVMKALSASSF